MAKIYLDPGHGGTDPGATGHGLQEKNLTLSIAKYARDYLLNNYQDVQVRMSRTTDKTVSLGKRTRDANNWGADIFASIHINAFNGRAKGYEDFIYNGPIQSTTRTLQNAVHKELSKFFATNRGKKKANFHVLRETAMPAVLTESGFIDNKADADFLRKDSNLKKLDEAHARGIASYLNLKSKAVAKSPSNKGGGNSDKLYYVQIGAFGSKRNADYQVIKAKQAGFKDAYVKKEGDLYKVQIGAFSNKKNADAQVAKAKKLGFDAFVVG